MNDRERLQQDEDFVHSTKNKNSIEEIQKKNPDGLSDKEIAKCLAIPLKHVKLLYQSALKKIRKTMRGA